MESSNPTLRKDTFRGFSPALADDRMTVNGVVAKSAILLLLVGFTFIYSWNAVATESSAAGMLIMGGGIVGLVLSLVISFKQSWSPVLAPAFALAEGALLGGISAVYEQGYGGAGGYPGIVLEAGFATMCVFATMLLTYRTGLIKVTDRFRAVISMAMFSIFAFYLLSFLLSFAGVNMPYINDASPIGIGLSVVVIVVASMMLLVDFDMIERGARAGAPKYMEWYGAFALLVTIVWIYLEILRLLAKLRER